MKKALAIVGLVLAVTSGSAWAQEFKQENFYAGAGINLNSASGVDDAVGVQLFVGYELDMIDAAPIALAVEAGYMDTGNFEWRGRNVGSASGLWATAVASYRLNPELDVLARLGLDLGDDDGLMLGVGVGYALSKEIAVRGEYVVRDNIDSLQANVVLRF